MTSTPLPEQLKTGTYFGESGFSSTLPPALPEQGGFNELRLKIARQIVKARVPGYKMTNGDLNDEARLVPDVYIDNIISLFKDSELELVKTGFYGAAKVFGTDSSTTDSIWEAYLMLLNIEEDTHGTK